jgi:NADPH:quinone reductase
MRVVAFAGAGGNDIVHVEERPDPEITSAEILVDVEVAGLNPADLQQRKGFYPPPSGVVPDVAGLEVSGRVISAGGDVSRWAVGDRVFGLVAGGGLASRVAVDERCVTRVPDRLSDEEAAAVPEVFITAHDALTTQGELRRGETVLVQGASGAVGSAALQIARAIDARVLGVVRSDEGSNAVRAFGAEPIRAPDVASATNELTDGRGVDLVLELVGSSNLRDDMDVLATRGRIIVISVASGSRAELDLLQLMIRRATVRGTVLRARSIAEKARAVSRFAADVVPMLTDGRARPTIDSVFGIGEVHAAFDRLERPGKSGKVLLRFS